MKKTTQPLDFSSIIRKEMVKKGLTQRELSRRSNVRCATISDYLLNKKEIQTGNLERLLTTLNAKVIFLKNQIYEPIDKRKQRR